MGGVARGNRSTSWRWGLAAWIALIAAYSAVIVDNNRRIDAYERAVAAASVRAEGHVAAVEPRSKVDDVVEVIGVDAWGREARWRFKVRSVADLRVGEPFPVMWAPEAPAVVYPVDQSRVSTVDHLVAGIVLAGVGALLLAGGWTARLVRWWWAARSPARRYRATLLLSYSPGRLTATPWLRLSGDGTTWYQRMMWEPWLTGALEHIPVEARRAGRRGPFVVDVPRQGRLWPAGRARRREPSTVELLEAGSYEGALTRRWPILFVSFVFGHVTLGPAAGAAIALTFAATILFFGGPPILLTWRP